MTESLSTFPKLSQAAGRRERDVEEAGVVINGAKVVFDKEAALLPTDLQPKKEKPANGKHN